MLEQVKIDTSKHNEEQTRNIERKLNELKRRYSEK